MTTDKTIVCRVTAAKGVAELWKDTNNFVYVYYYRNSGRTITDINNKPTETLVKTLLSKAEKECKKRNLTLWSY